jgi:branched-chain amino acid transport system substrate-binding protein
MKLLAPVMALAVLAALPFVACDRSGKTFNLGGVAPVTGEGATFGLSDRNAMKLAVEEWNAKGGVLGKKVRLFYADDKGDPAEGATVFTKLIEQERVSAIVGAAWTKVSLAGAPICQERGVPMISPTSTNPKVTLVGDHIFRACFIDPFQGTIGARFCIQELKAKKAACLFDIGNDYTRGLAEFFAEQFKAMGGEITGFEAYATGSPDFKVQLTKIIHGRPDIIYAPNYYHDASLICKQARELGFNSPIVGGDGWDSSKLVEIGGPAVDGCFFTAHYAKDDPRPRIQDFVKLYRAKYNTDPDGNACMAYDATHLLLDAVRRAGSSEGKAIRDALQATDLEVVSGRIKFDQNRNPVKPAAVIEVKNGTFRYHSTIQPI